MEEHARPPIVEALDAAMQLVELTYEDVAGGMDEHPALQRFGAMRDAIRDRAVAEDRVDALAADLKLAERALQHVRHFLPDRQGLTGGSDRMSGVGGLLSASLSPRWVP